MISSKRRISKEIDNPHIVIGDDHTSVRAGVRALLQQAFPGASFSEATTVGEVLGVISESPHEVDLVLLDLDMPGADIDAEKRLRTLSPQQLRILRLVVEGKLNKQIAFEMNIAEQTVKAHVSIIFQKLGVSNRTQAAILVAGKPNAGLFGLQQVLTSFPGIPVAILSAQADPAIIKEAIRLGASGYIPKTASVTTMAEAVRAILNGDVWVPRDVSLDEEVA